MEPSIALPQIFNLIKSAVSRSTAVKTASRPIIFSDVANDCQSANSGMLNVALNAKGIAFLANDLKLQIKEAFEKAEIPIVNQTIINREIL